MKRFLLLCFFMLTTLCASEIYAQNIVLNGGFENWSNGPNPTPNSWTIAQAMSGTIASNATALELTKSCRIAATTANYTISQNIAVTGGKTYTFKVSYYVQTSTTGGNDARIACAYRTATSAIAMTLEDSIALKGPGGTTGFLPTSVGAWKTYTYDVVMPTRATNFVFSITTSRGATVLWDDFSLTENTTPTIYKYTYNATSGFNYSPSMTGFDYAPGVGPSAEQSFVVRASNLTGSLTVTAPTNYEISIGTGASFSGTTSLTIPPTSGQIAAMTFYLRLKSGLNASIYAGNVTLSSNGATPQTIPVTGTVAVPPVTITPSVNTLTGFSYGEGSGPSAEQSFMVKGSNLTSGITISVPANYELSVLSGTAFSGTTSLSIPQSGGTVATTTIYVRLKAGLSIGSYPNTISLTSTGGTTKTVSLTGTVTSAPGISASVTSITGMDYLVGAGPSAIKSVTFSAASLTTFLIINASTNFEISTDGGALFAPTGQIVLAPASGIVAPTIVYVRLKSGLAKATYTENIVASSTGMTSKSVSVTGSVSIATGTTSADAASVSIAKTTTGIRLEGISINDLVSVYNLTGMRVYSSRATSQSVDISLPKGSVYIIQTNGETTKIVL